MARYQDVTVALETAFGREKVPSKAELDFQIWDIWNVYSRITTDQDYYFVGSRGSGKTTLISKAVARIAQSNKNVSSKTLPCVVNCGALLPSGKALAEIHSQRFVYHFFDRLASSLGKSMSSNFIYMWWRNRKWRNKLEALLDGHQTSYSAKDFLLSSRVRLKLISEIGSIGFSLLEGGPISIGNLNFVPIKLSVDREEQKTPIEVPQEISKDATEIDRQYKRAIDELIKELARETKKLRIHQIIMLIDDAHFLPLSLQLDVIRTLRYISRVLRSLDVKMAFKLFSATDFSSDIYDTLNLTQKELHTINIEASLENLDARRLAVENLLNRVLVLGEGFEENEIQEMFPRGIIDQALVLSGGHPRHFLQILTRMLERSQGVQGDQVYQTIMLSAAEVVNESRENMLVQLGIDPDSRAKYYKSWYEKTIRHLVEWCIDVAETPYLMISLTQLRNNKALGQWINDAIAVGDFLEIAEKYIGKDSNAQQFCKLLAVNPATIYDLTGKFDNHLVTYQEVANIQSGARSVPYGYGMRLA